MINIIFFNNIVKQAYFAYFKVRLGDQVRFWALHMVCKQCVKSLWMDCYFRLMKTSWYNKKNKYKIKYPSLPSAICLESHLTEIPVPVLTRLLSLVDLDPDEELDDCQYADFEIEDDSACKGFDQNELNDLAWYLGLSKVVSELLASRLNEKNFLEKGAKISYFQSILSSFLQYFQSDSSFVYCHNIQDLLQKLGILMYISIEWWLFIDILKFALLHNGNLYGAVTIGHSICLHVLHEDKESLRYCNITNTIGSSVLTLKWYASFLGQQHGYTNIPAFCVCGIAELERSVGWRWIGLQDLTSNLAIPTFYMRHSLTERKLYSNLCTLNCV